MRCIVLLLSAFLSTSAMAKVFSLMDCTFVTTSPYTVELVRIGGKLTSIHLSPTVTYEGVTYRLTSIGDYAFSDCTSLANVSIPNSVTEIGEGLFLGCSSLSSPVYNDHYFLFLPAGFVGDYTVPDGIEFIVSYAFQGCYNLTSITIPEGVTHIGKNAFCGCYYLNAISILSNMIHIDEDAFLWCNDLKSVTIPKNLIGIDEKVFPKDTKIIRR